MFLIDQEQNINYHINDESNSQLGNFHLEKFICFDFDQNGFSFNDLVNYSQKKPNNSLSAKSKVGKEEQRPNNVELLFNPQRPVVQVRAGGNGRL